MSKPIILSIKYGGHDTAASLMRGGRLIAACEQERYTLDKHSRLFPNDAIVDCLKIGRINIDEVDEIAFVNDVMDYIRKLYLVPALETDERIGFLINDLERIKEAYTIEERIRYETSYKGPVTFYRHHLCHLASSYYPSGFKESLLVSYDGLGEYETSMMGVGRNGKIEIIHNTNYYPHSVGLLYSAITFYLGWRHHCDEGIIMALACYGNPDEIIPGKKRTYYDVFSEILRETGDYDFIVDQGWMAYYRVRDTWISKKFLEMFGPKRQMGDPLTKHHMNIAAALQKRLEDVVLNQLKRARKQFGIRRLGLAGGVALNCSMNGKVRASGLFDEVFVQPAAGDAGCTIGACYLAHGTKDKNLKPEIMHNFYTGSESADTEIQQAFKKAGLSFEKPKNLYDVVAERLKNGKIVGWFQGRAEFGPRALGNRSILCRPYPAEMKDHINKRVKFREWFRPLAPAVLWEHANEYFQIDQESPHMLMAVKVASGKKDVIPAVVHIDDSCRVQTVKYENNQRFWKLLKSFHEITGIPVILNTSFNVKGQPIVNTAEHAIQCYKSTGIDCLVVGDYFVEKSK